MSKNFFPHFVIFVALIPGAATADEILLAPEIVVTGKRLRADHRSAHILTESQLSRESGRPIGEVLRETAGVDFTLGTGGNSSLLIRGSSGSQTLVIIDGVKVNDPSASNRYFDWSRIDTTQIERVEILKGPQAVSYGSDAIGGVVLIRTKNGFTGPDGVTSSASVEGGSEAFFRARGTVGTPVGKFLGGEHILRISSVGRAVFDGGSAALSQTGAPLEGDNSEDLSVAAEVGSVWSENVRSRTVVELRAAREDIDAGPFDDDPNYVSRNREIRGSSRVDGRFGNGLEWGAIASHLDLRRMYADLSDPAHPCSPFFPCGSDTIYRGSNTRVEFHLRSDSEAVIEWTSGMELARETVWIDSVLSPTVLARNHANTAAVFFESAIPLNTSRSVMADFGARFSTFTEFGNQWSGKAGMNFRPADSVELDFGISTGFKAPSLYSLYHPTSGNPDLRPEESIQVEAGSTLQFTSSLEGSIRGFGNRTRNRFGNAGVPPYQSISIERSEVLGAEIGIGARFGRFLFSPSLTYLYSEDLSNGRALPEVPRWKGALKASCELNAENSLTLSLISKSNRESSAAGQRTPGFTRLDFSSRHELSRRLSLTGRVENLLDRDYQEIRGYRTPGLSAYAGLEIRSH